MPWRTGESAWASPLWASAAGRPSRCWSNGCNGESRPNHYRGDGFSGDHGRIRRSDDMEIQTVGVVGGGQMGSGIAQVCLMSGFKVLVNDISDAILRKSRAAIEKGLDTLVRKEKITPADKERMAANLALTVNLSDLSASDFVVEAATEREELKLALFRKLDEIVLAGEVLAPNTSSLPITRSGHATP